MITFTKAVEVAPGRRVSSREHNLLARAINERFLSGLGDGCFRVVEYMLGLFRAITMDNGLYDEHIRPQDTAEVAIRRSRLDALNETFLAAYEAHAPVSRERVALWEAIFYLNDSLQCWTKPRPNDPRLVVTLLERQLGVLGIV